MAAQADATPEIAIRPEQKSYRLLSFVWAGLFLAIFLTPLLMMANWFQRLNADSPEVPEPSWTDPIWALLSFCCNFPASLLLKSDSPNVIWSFLDAVFWGFVCLGLYRGFVFTRRYSEAKHYIKPALMFLLSLPVIYVLTLGLTVFIWGKYHLERSCPTMTRVAAEIYSPVANIAMKDSSSGKLLRRYFHFCNPEFPEELPAVPSGL